MTDRIYFKGLNGIRAIAAIAVVLSHTGLALNDFGFTSYKGLDMSAYGVTMFFSLSGFLITYLLLAEKEKQSIDIKKFYLRRILRIWPLYFIYLFLCLATIYFNDLAQFDNKIVYYFILSANIPIILGTYYPLISHYWSLGVEEQFYLFWPWVIKKVKKPFYFILASVICFMLIKLGLKLINAKMYYPKIEKAFRVTRFDCMAIGALGAIVLFEKKKRLLAIIQSLPVQIIAWVSYILIALNLFRIAYIFDQDIIAFITAILIINLSQNPKTIISFENKIMDFLGKISYGIYVIHPLIIYFLSKLLPPIIHSFSKPLQYVIIYCLVVGVTLTLAFLSYTYVEKFFLRLKDKFSVVHSSSSAVETHR